MNKLEKELEKFRLEEAVARSMKDCISGSASSCRAYAGSAAHSESEQSCPEESEISTNSVLAQPSITS